MKNFEAISASLYPYDVDPFLESKENGLDDIAEEFDTRSKITDISTRGKYI